MILRVGAKRGRAMLISRITRILFWSCFGVVAAAILALLLLYIGVVDELFGWPENAAAESLKLGWVIDKIKSNKDPIDLAIKVIGLAFTVIIGTLAFLVKWFNSSLNFPLRLAEYAARLKRKHFMGRAAVLAPLGCRNLAGELRFRRLVLHSRSSEPQFLSGVGCSTFGR
jgi:hypothetical protein